jgi:hypothetical protein
MRVRPDASAPNIKERCEIDLSPGTLIVPARGPERDDVAATGRSCDVMEYLCCAGPAAGLERALVRRPH